MNKRDPIEEMRNRGSPYAKVGLLLERVNQAGGIIPSHFFPQDDDPKRLEAVKRHRAGLYQGILSAFMWAAISPALTQKGRSESRAAALSKIENRLAAVLADIDRHNLGPELAAKFRNLSDDAPSFFELVCGMKKLKEFSRQLALEAGDAAPPLQINMSPQSLRLNRLAKCYRTSLEMEPQYKLSRNYHNLDGPFAEFLRAAYAVRGLKPPKDNALEKALERAGVI